MKLNLLIDIGNSRMKWAVDSRQGFSVGGNYLSQDLQLDSTLVKDWEKISPDSILISCVGKQSLLQKVQQQIQNKWGMTAELLISPAKANGVSNAYSEPEKLGSDRWASMVGAFAQFKKTICVVGCGTAVTLDIVTADGQHQGGLISPGLRLSQQCLHSETNMEFMMSDSEHQDMWLGKSTEQCIQLGTLKTIAGMISTTYSHCLKKYGDVTMIMTGGDACHVQRYLENDVQLVDDMVLRGLAVIQRSRSEVVSS